MIVWTNIDGVILKFVNKTQTYSICIYFFCSYLTSYIYFFLIKLICAINNFCYLLFSTKPTNFLKEKSEATYCH